MALALEHLVRIRGLSDHVRGNLGSLQLVVAQNIDLTCSFSFYCNFQAVEPLVVFLSRTNRTIPVLRSSRHLLRLD